MGLDAIVEIRGDLTEVPHRFTFSCHNALDAERNEMIDIVGYCDNGWDFHLDRYWSKVYPRGDWPHIYALIRACKTAWPNATIYYSSDHDNPGEERECTDEYLAQQWEDWTSIEAVDE